ncbi:MAG: adenylate/guanylate cyclase domain-containing protein [Legionellales bacterium]|nr:adenylate/guanylate cyclase domain-containing protein [Legionellales bacterium]
MTKKMYPLIAGIIVVVIAVWAAITPNPIVRDVLHRLDYLMYDLRVRLTLPSSPAPTPIAIIDIDEKSLSREGRWPWPRHKIAQLIENLRDYGAIVIAFDIIFSEEERNVTETILNSNQITDQELQNSLKNVSQHFDHDKRLSDVIAKNNDIVLGFIFHHDKKFSQGQLPESFFIIEKFNPNQLMLISFPGYTSNIATLQQQTLFHGFLTTARDTDGVIRRTPLVIRYENKLYPALGLSAAKAYLLSDEIIPNFIKLDDYIGLESIALGKQIIPTDIHGQVIVPYQGKQGRYPYYSASDVLEKKLKPQALENTLVFIGTTSLGLGDLHTTPVDPVYPGVEIHANIANGILQQQFPYEPSWNKGAELLTIITLGLILTFLLPFLGPLTLSLVALFSVALVIGGDLWLWNVKHWLLSTSIPLLMIVTLASLNMLYGFLFANRKSRTLREAFGQYVPPDHVKRISENPSAYGFEGESRELTVLFADIRNFTTISENLAAAQLRQLLNKYFTPMTEIIFNCGGTIDKYVGDMIMAFWGAPVEDLDHRQHACQAALAMIEKSNELKPEFRALNLPEFNIGIGINTGIMNVGDMGSEFRRSYTVLGDAVNLGSRIEGTTKYYGVKIAVGAETRKKSPDYVFRKLDRVLVKGKHTAVEVFELICHQNNLTPAISEEITLHEQALEYYFSQQWHMANELFEKLNQDHPQKILYQLMLNRINDYLINPPPPNWDGAYERGEK